MLNAPRPRQRMRSLRDKHERRDAMSVSVTQHKMFIGGEWVESSSGETMEVLNPATGEVIAEVPRGTAEDVERAVDGGPEGLGRVARQDAEGPHGAAARARRHRSTSTPRSSRGSSR